MESLTIEESIFAKKQLGWLTPPAPHTLAVNPLCFGEALSLDLPLNSPVNSLMNYLVAACVVLKVCGGLRPISESGLLRVAVFPLSKRPRLPTEELRLNLFEPRYVALAEFALAEPAAIFGAVFCEGPQLLPRGTGPPTPIVAAGAVGVLCAVASVDRVAGDGGDRLRCVKIVAHAIARFRVVDVSSSPALSPRRDDDDDAPPYILVDALSFCDQDDDKLHHDAGEQLLSRESSAAVASANRVFWILCFVRARARARESTTGARTRLVVSV